MVNLKYKNLYELIYEVTNHRIDDSDEFLRLEEDLGIYGDDAVEFMTSYAEKFGVDITGFCFDEYFNSETDKISLFIAKLLGRSTKKKKSLTIADLKKGIRNKRLS